MRKVKVKDVLEGSHSLMNDIVISTAKIIEDADIIIKIDDLLKERGITQKDLAYMTGMRVGTISDLVNGKGISFNKVQLISVMVALRVTSFSEIFEIRLPNTIREVYETEANEWKASKEIPLNLKEMYRENLLKTSGLNR